MINQNRWRVQSRRWRGISRFDVLLLLFLFATISGGTGQVGIQTNAALKTDGSPAVANPTEMTTSDYEPVTHGKRMLQKTGYEGEVAEVHDYGQRDGESIGEAAESVNRKHLDAAVYAPIDGLPSNQRGQAANSSEEARKRVFGESEAGIPYVAFISLGLRGHVFPLLRIAQSLAKLDYRVSFATHNESLGWIPTAEDNIKFLSVGDFPLATEALEEKLHDISQDTSTFRGILHLFNEVYLPTSLPMYKALLPIYTADRPDLIVADIGSIGALDLVEKLGLPHIINSPTVFFDLQGLPLYVPAWGTGFSKNMTLWNRCMNVLFPRLLSVALTPAFMHVSRIRWELGLPPFRSQHDVFVNSRLLLDTTFALEHPRPITPLVDLIGPILPDHVTYNIDDLPPRIVELAKKDLVYVFFGSMVSVTKQQAEVISQGVQSIADENDYNVLWVVTKNQRKVVPEELPQRFELQDMDEVDDFQIKILSTVSVSAVVNHCGMGTVQESIYYGAPLLCIPFFADQIDLGARVEDAGVGRMIEKSEITAEGIRALLQEILTGDKYMYNVERVRDSFRRAGGVDKAVNIIRSTLAIGYDHLKPVDVDIPWHQQVMLDVIAIHVAIFCILVVISRVVFVGSKFAFRRVRTRLRGSLGSKPKDD